jgi:hypothetical protein
MTWLIETRPDGWRTAECQHGQAHGIYPHEHECDHCCLAPDFPIDSVMPIGAPIAVQHVPAAVTRMKTWETPRIIVDLLASRPMTRKMAHDATSRPDFNAAMLWLREGGFVSSRLTTDSKQQTFSLTVLGKTAARHFKEGLG